MSYSEADLQSAINAGAISAEAAEALRAHVAAGRSAPIADDEQFRLVTGFNDIFVTIACALVIFASAAIGGHALGGWFVAAACWAMAEVFTKRRRLALPSIVLLLGFVVALGLAVGDVVGALLPAHAVPHRYGPQLNQVLNTDERYPWQTALIFGAGAFAAALGALAHWRRFRVPITIAAGVGGAVLLLLSLIAAALNQTPGSNAFLPPAALICGLAVFAYAMRWDLSDPDRRTPRADIAFWLHLLAAPLIVHPLFFWMGVTGGGQVSALVAAGVLAIYVFFAAVALAIDRRALLVSALAYVLIALGQLFRQYGAVELNVALTALVIGTALLMLSAFWAPIRAAVLGKLPPELVAKLPRSAISRSA